MLSVKEARSKVVSALSPLTTEMVSIAQAHGRVLADPTAARVTQPPAAVSAMDGYAVRSADLKSQPTTLQRVGMSRAGEGFVGPVGPGTCVRIFTGAPLPEGCDAVIMQEDTEDHTEGERGAITFREVAFAGKFVRKAGLDFTAGDILLEAGTRLSSRDIGLLAAMNVPWVRVYRKPKVAILATGDEIVMPGDPMGPDSILSSNTLMMSSFVRALGAEPLNLGIAADSEDSLKTLLDGLDGADMLVTCGGISVGEYDLVKGTLDKRGLDIGFYKVAMKPGKPFMFGQIDGKPVMGLPGNPVSSFVTAFVFLRPALAVMEGLDAPDDLPHQVLLGKDLPKGGPRPEYLRASLGRDENGTRTVRAVDGQDSAQLAQLASANALILRAANEESVKAGAFVPVLSMPEAAVVL